MEDAEQNPQPETKADLLDELDMRERRYIEGRLAGKSKTQAALDAGYTESMAAKAGDKIESKDVRRAFQELARQAVPTEKIMQRLAEGLDAVRLKPVVRDKKIIGTVEEPDYRERREYMELASRYGGRYIDRSEIDLSGEVNVGDPEQRIRELLDRADSRRAPVP
jgi:phage terminase small subunit